MTQHFNQLTPAEDERLAMLAEEAAEIIQIVCKIQRHGYESYHPDDPTTTNRQLLRQELTDLRGVWEMMMEGGEASPLSLSDIVVARQRKLRYAHHQGVA